MYYSHDPRKKIDDLNREQQRSQLVINNEFVLSHYNNNVFTIDFNKIINIYIHGQHLINLIFVDKYPKTLLNDVMYLMQRHGDKDTLDLFINALIMYEFTKLTYNKLFKFIALIKSLIQYVDSVQMEYSKMNKIHNIYGGYLESLNEFLIIISSAQRSNNYLSFLLNGSVYMEANRLKSFNVSQSIVSIFYKYDDDIIKNIQYIEDIYKLIDSCEYEYYHIIGTGYYEIASAVSGQYRIQFDTKGNEIPTSINRYFETSFMKYEKSMNYLHLYILDIIVNNIKDNIRKLINENNQDNIIELCDINELLGEKMHSTHMYIRHIYHWFKNEYEVKLSGLRREISQVSLNETYFE